MEFTKEIREEKRNLKSEFYNLRLKNGGLAQLARAPALHAGGQRFDSVILHKPKGQISKKEIPKPNYWNLEFKNWNFRWQKFIDILR